MTFRTMSASEWASVRDNPIQRNTERHAAKAHHLANPSKVHAFVSAALLPDGKLIKLDGHTRSFLWERGVVAAPSTLHVTIIPVRDEEEAKSLYKTFDSKDALETSTDRVSGAFHNIGFVPQSPLLARGSITNALKIAWLIAHNLSYARRNQQAAFDVYQATEEFSSELVSLDNLGLTPGKVTTALVAAILVSYRKHGDKVTPFWTGVKENNGLKEAGRMDGIQAIIEMLLAKRTGGGGSSGAFAFTARMLTAVERWFEQGTFANMPRPLDLIGYCDTASPRFKLLRKAGAAAQAE